MTPLSDRVWDAADPVWRTFGEIASRLAMDRMHVRRHLDDLVQIGWLEYDDSTDSYRHGAASQVGT